MKLNEIGKVFTNETIKALADGYHLDATIYTGSMSDVCGRQTVLSRGNDRLIMWVSKDSRSEEEFFKPGEKWEHVYVYTAYIAKFTATEHECEWQYRWAENWMEHAKVLGKFYATHCMERDGWVVDNLDDIREAAKKRDERHATRRISPCREVEIDDARWEVIKRVPGFKRGVKREDVTLTYTEETNSRSLNFVIRANDGRKVSISRHGKQKY